MVVSPAPRTCSDAPTTKAQLSCVAVVSTDFVAAVSVAWAVSKASDVCAAGCSFCGADNVAAGGSAAVVFDEAAASVDGILVPAVTGLSAAPGLVVATGAAVASVFAAAPPEPRLLHQLLQMQPVHQAPHRRRQRHTHGPALAISLSTYGSFITVPSDANLRADGIPTHTCRMKFSHKVGSAPVAGNAGAAGGLPLLDSGGWNRLGGVCTGGAGDEVGGGTDMVPAGMGSVVGAGCIASAAASRLNASFSSSCPIRASWSSLLCVFGFQNRPSGVKLVVDRINRVHDPEPVPR